MRHIDENALRTFYQGDDALLVDLTTIFFDRLPTILEQLQTAVSNRDAHHLRELSHQFKSNLGYFFVDDLREMASELERRGRDGNLEGCEEIAARLFLGVDELIVELTERTKVQPLKTL